MTIQQALHAAYSFRARGQGGAAEDLCRQILAAYPEHANTLHTMGVIAGEAGRYEESIAFISKALRTSDMPGVCFSDIGIAYLRLGKLAEAEESFRRSLLVRPDVAETENNLAEALLGQKKIEEAIEHCRSALAINPNYSKARANLGLLLLLSGDYERGFVEYEWRASAETVPDPTTPRWNGELASGKTIVVRAEQGLGDTIQFMRYLPLLSESGMARVVVECDPALLRLTGSFRAPGVVFTDTKPVSRFDYEIALLSLPLALRKFEPLPMSRPYLSADRAWLRDELRPDRCLRVGLAWAGNSAHSRDRQRSIDPSSLAPLVAVAGVDFFSLQVGQAAPEGVMDATAGISDFADTAAIIAGLDLVISVDTAVAHLAGAMGKPVWTLLPFVPDWRWGLEGDSTPWYPTMRLFRQKRAGDWPEVIERVAERLRGKA